MKKNIFDSMTKLPRSAQEIEEITVYEDTGIDSKMIENNVLSSLGLGTAKHKKKLLRKIIIAAAAAALAVGIFTVPVVAENMYVLYGSVVGGDEYTADFVNVKDASIKIHDPNLQIDSLQVSANEGADNLIDIRLSKKNGGKFTSDSFSIIKDGNFSARLSNWEDPDKQNSHQLEMIIDDTDSENCTIDGLGYHAVYGVENGGKTLHILIAVNVSAHDGNGNDIFGKSLQGKKISIKSNNYLAASVDDVLGTFDEINNQNISQVYELRNNNSSVIPYDLFTNSYYYSDIIYTDNKFEVVKGRNKLFSLPFEIEFTMDCEPANNIIPVSDETLNQIFGSHPTDGKMTVSSAGFFLYAKNDTTANLPDDKQCYLTTKDGSKYYLIGNGCEYSEKNIVMNCTFGKFPNNEFSNNFDNKFYLIDPENISKIVLNDITVYEN